MISGRDTNTNAIKKLQQAIAQAKALFDGKKMLEALKALESILAELSVQNILADKNNVELRQQFQKIYAESLSQVTKELNAISRHLFVSLTDLDKFKENTNNQFLRNAYDNLRGFIIREILNTADLNERTIVLERWINVMQQCFISGDFFTAKVIFIALNSTAIDRLKATQAGLSPQTNAMLQEMAKYFMTPKDTFLAMKARAAGTYIPHYIEFKAKFIGLTEGFSKDSQTVIADAIKELNEAIEAQKKLDNVNEASLTSIQQAVINGADITEKESLELVLTREPKEKQHVPCDMFKRPELTSIIIPSDFAATSSSVAGARTAKEKETALSMIATRKKRINMLKLELKLDTRKERLVKFATTFTKQDESAKRCRDVLNDIISLIAVFNENPAEITNLVEYLTAALKDQSLLQQSGVGSIIQKVSKPKIIKKIEKLLKIFQNEKLNSEIKDLVKWQNQIGIQAGAGSRLSISSVSQLNLSSSRSNVSIAGSFISRPGTPLEGSSRSSTPSLSDSSRRSVMFSVDDVKVPTGAIRIAAANNPPALSPLSRETSVASIVSDSPTKTAVTDSTKSASGEKSPHKSPRSPADKEARKHRHHHSSRHSTPAPVVAVDTKEKEKETEQQKTDNRRIKRLSMSDLDLQKISSANEVKEKEKDKRKSVDLPSSAREVVKRQEDSVSSPVAACPVSARATIHGSLRRGNAVIISRTEDPAIPSAERKLTAPPLASDRSSLRISRTSSKSDVKAYASLRPHKSDTVTKAAADAASNVSVSQCSSTRQISESFAKKLKAHEDKIAEQTPPPSPLHRSSRASAPDYSLYRKSLSERDVRSLNVSHGTASPRIVLASKPASHSTGSRETSVRDLNEVFGQTNPSPRTNMPRTQSNAAASRESSLRNVRNAGEDKRPAPQSSRESRTQHLSLRYRLSTPNLQSHVVSAKKESEKEEKSSVKNNS